MKLHCSAGKWLDAMQFAGPIDVRYAFRAHSFARIISRSLNYLYDISAGALCVVNNSLIYLYIYVPVPAAHGLIFISTLGSTRK